MGHPLLLQVHCRCLLSELSIQAGSKTLLTLKDVPDRFFTAVESDGFDVLYLLGVWQTGAAGIAMSKDKLGDSVPVDQVCSSPFAVTAYQVHSDFGGPSALASFRQRLAKRGVRLFLDFVPNHVARDHPWTTSHPEYIVCAPAGSEAVKAAPQNFFTPAKGSDGSGTSTTGTGAGAGTGTGTVLAHGRDKNYDGWTDTAQLNYFNPALQAAMVAILQDVAAMCDGVRCDMAMLPEKGVFNETWGAFAQPHGVLKEQWWPGAIAAAKKVNTNFQFMAEVYWDMEWDLQQLGFDYTYDKRLYDRLVDNDATGIAGHLKADMDFQNRSVRFLENHDEPRAAKTFGGDKRLLAAAVVAYTVPGLAFFHWGQEEGRNHFQSMHVAVRAAEAPVASIMAQHRLLLQVLTRPEVRSGTWTRATVSPSQDGNRSCDSIVAHTWSPTASADRGQCLLVIVNYADSVSDGHVAVPQSVLASVVAGVGTAVSSVAGGAGGGAGAGAGASAGATPGTATSAKASCPTPSGTPRSVSRLLLRDLLSSTTVYERPSSALGEGGVWFRLEPWQAHVFEVVGLLG